MKDTRLIMGMPITVEVIGPEAAEGQLQKTVQEIFEYFTRVDERFSTYKEESEITKINKKLLSQNEWSDEMREVMHLSEEWRVKSDGFFNSTKPDGSLDPSGLVKGWAIQKAADMLTRSGIQNFYIEAGGDIQTSGLNYEGKKWRVGIRNPFNSSEHVKVVHLSGEGVATSGTYVRGAHIYNPKSGKAVEELASLTVVGPSVYEADCLATAAFAMGNEGLNFIAQQKGYEGYSIDPSGIATMTQGFIAYTDHA